jgi:hypothetical protein
MHCPVCSNEFKNYNSFRVHRWRFHNPNTKYGKTPELQVGDTDGTRFSPEHSFGPPIAAATVGLASVKGDWKKWFILILILVAVALVFWYLVKQRSEEESHA